ncbi:MAG: cell division protein FtsA [Bacteroidia bacterium]|nr:cell division protein FtsA [Bacteroidia bacterium]
MQELYGIVDIGTHQVRVLIGQPEGEGRVSVLGMGVAPAEGIDERGVANIDRLAASIHKALKSAQNQSGVILKKVWVGLTHIDMRGETTQAIVTFRHADHEISLEDLERLRQQAVSRTLPPDMELIHVVPQMYHIDNRKGIREPLGMSGIRLEGQYYLLYAPQPYLNMLRRCLQRLELEIEGFVARPLITAETLLPPEYKAQGAALIYLGGHTTAVVVYRGGMLQHFTILPLGGYWITSDIREALRSILLTQAEELKIHQGSALAERVPEEELIRFQSHHHGEILEVRRRVLAEVIQARAEEIFLFVAKEIEKAGLLGQLYAGVYLAGGTALLRDIDATAEYILGEKVYIVDVRRLLGRGLVESVSSPRMAGVVSLLATAPVLKEFLPPLPLDSASSRPTTAKSKSPERGRFLQKIRSLLENSLKLPQELID